MKHALIAGLCALFLTGCFATYPLNLSEEEWEALSPEERLAAREKQAELDRAAAERRTAEAQAREAEAARQLAELEVRRREAGYGERLQCVMEQGELRSGSRWRAVEPFAVDVVEGMDVPFDYREQDRGRHRSNDGNAQFDGTTLTLCAERWASRPDSDYCVRVLGTFEDYRRGLRTSVDSERFLRGDIRCQLAPGRDGVPGGRRGSLR